MITVALVDDHTIFCKSLAVLIDMLDDFKVVSLFNNGREFIDSLNKETLLPDIVLMDVSMPVMDGIATTKWLKQNNYHLKIIALSMMKNDMVIIRMLQNGARGYLLKDCDPAELKRAMKDVYNKGYYYNEFLHNKPKSIIPQEDTAINENEFVFLKLCCTDKSYKEIADEMCVSPRTIDGYRDELFQKLDVSSRVGLAIYAIKNNIVQV